MAGKLAILSHLKRMVGLAMASIALLCATVAFASPRAEEQSPSKQDYFAIVGEESISMQEFQAAYQAGIRKRFYHGKVPEDQLRMFREEISRTLIDRSLLLQEARRQGVEPDQTEVEAQLAQYEERYQKQAYWQEHRQDILQGLRAALEEESRLVRFERQVKTGVEPSVEQVKNYYRQHPNLFTTPEQLRLSLILLKVAPSSPGDVWQAAHEEALQIRERLDKGADFAELARIHSGDRSASAGGDMGFLHQGMLAAPVQQAVDPLSPGELSLPVMLLTGVGIFRLEERVAARLNDYESVAGRALQLQRRELSEAAWSELLEKLRASVKVSINTAVQ